MSERKTKETKSFLSVRELCMLALSVALIEACKICMYQLPNIELTTFWLVIFTLFFGRKMWFVVPVFTVIEGMIFGFGDWWAMYLVAWPLLVLIVSLLRRFDSAIVFAGVSGVFGLLFGFFCSGVHFILGAHGDGITEWLASGARAAFGWWIAGIPYDLIHGVANFLIMLVLYRPVTSVMKKMMSQRK